MAHDEKLADKIREALTGFELTDIEEKKMFRGLCFMVNGKMCICVSGDEMLCRIGPGYKDALELNGVRGMIRAGKALKDFVFVSSEAMKTKKEFDSWINRSVAFNKFAKATKK
ncbi:TfoX/Sxy family protein [Mucilaginibacter sp. UR6-11]|uniref:TfoX/Sxy family protein n=1 Tax=Mucilaginibacter sp. UR6-11 TaxID=1435644 RepID=UPI001E40EC1F|nr:TfoX/Sxy family protein [Mucilaginibacter sp. UR6-11]MCC8425852.1 TfoX/Sxy family protein [Mucilaginibacter sp. UR6-11]